MDEFISGLDHVTKWEDLCDLICNLGLFMDDRGIYDEYERFQVAQGGCWQNPRELAMFLWDSRDTFQGAESYLDIGTFNGYTFFVIMNFLKKFVNPNIRCKTIDPLNNIEPSIAPYVLPYYECCTSDDIAYRNEQYDIVFVDGCHEAPWPMRDFKNFCNSSSVIFFHDVVDKWCPAVTAAFSSAAETWGTKKYVYSRDQATFGIGVVLLRRPPSPA